jgi:peptidoglycan/LPS O-acetylase OafA/YrhL/lysophospholipase L1-like esterase
VREDKVSTRHFQHLPALDGLRGLAVLVVVWFHLGGSAGHLMQGGYLGVDLFFVLSGFLITSILIAEHARNSHIDFKAFWIRRARRLLPAVLALMPAIALYTGKFARRDELPGLRNDALATLAYVSNWRAVFSEKDYWQMFAAPSPLEHTWSLSIEEQFYLVWPLLFAFVLGKQARTRAALLCTLAAAVSAALMIALYKGDSTVRSYFGTDTRAAAILVGAALAFHAPQLSARTLNRLGALALLLLCVAFSRMPGQAWFLYHGGFWLTELACCVLILCARDAQEGFIAKALSAKPLRVLGTYSYGVYLWHWPLFCVLIPERVHVGGGALTCLRLAATALMALVSYHALEAPIRARGLSVLLPARSFLVSALAVLASFVLAFGVVAGGARYAEARYVSANISPFDTPLGALPAQKLGPDTLKILTLGDSVSQKLGNTLRIHQRSVGAWVVDRGVGNCNILEDNRLHKSGETWKDNMWHLGHPKPGEGCAGNWVRDVEEIRPDLTFIVIGGAFLHDKTHEIFVDDVNANACENNFQQPYEARLAQILTEIRPHAGTIVFARAPYPGQRWRHEGLLEDVDCFNAMIDRFTKAHAIPTVDVAQRLCPTRDCMLLEDGEPIRPDGLHPECPGANALAKWTLAELMRIARP